VKESHMKELTTIASAFVPKETMDRLETEIRANGMKVFARIYHAAGQTRNLIIFGNARSGTPLTQACQARLDREARDHR
jgi:uncharacterized protein (DUF302 family)